MKKMIAFFNVNDAELRLFEQDGRFDVELLEYDPETIVVEVTERASFPSKESAIAYFKDEVSDRMIKL